MGLASTATAPSQGQTVSPQNLENDTMQWQDAQADDDFEEPVDQVEYDDNIWHHGSRHGNEQARTRFASPPSFFSRVGLRNAWEAMRQRVRNPSYPSTRSQSSNEYGDDPISLRRLGGGSKSRSAPEYEPTEDNGDEQAVPEPVHHIVVDSDLGQYIPSSESDNGSAVTPVGGTGLPTTTDGLHSSHNGVSGLMAGDGSSIRRDRRKSWIRRTSAWELLVERCWPAVRYFFDSKFPETAKEKSYQKERWLAWRPAAIAASLFYLIAWLLTTAIQAPPRTAFTWYGYFGIAGFFILPLPLLVILDFGRFWPFLYQAWLFCATWVMSWVVLVEMHLCGFFTNHSQCGSKGFLGLFYWAIGLPVLAVFALGMRRDWHMLGMMVWIGLVIGLFLVNGTRALVYRNMIDFILFHICLLFTSYLKEMADRQLFQLRTQLKLQYRATQAAQVAERKASDSKKRFVSYIFHEVRVPLNTAGGFTLISLVLRSRRTTAVLSTQNLEGEGVFDECNPDQRDLLNGLTGSLSMMEKVLNDVLSFNRMASGNFTQTRKPFDFHQSVQLVVLSHRSQAMSAGLSLTSELDPEIDKFGGVFIGDEMRLRQVMSNLVSNACKFCPSGSVRIVTKLLFPRTDSTGNAPDIPPVEEKHLELEHEQQHIECTRQQSPDSGEVEIPPDSTLSTDAEKTSISQNDDSAPTRITVERLRQIRDMRESVSSTQPLGVRIPRKPAETKVIVRVEVHDTGVGLQMRDVRDNRLFSPYVQTEIGRRQGGKGSGLGLALCMQIIRLCGGRLGVDSQLGKGSCFWFEVVLLLPPPTTGDGLRQPNRTSSLPSTEQQAVCEQPSVIVNDKFYDGTGHGLVEEMVRAPNRHLESDSSDVLAPELELSVLSRQPPASAVDTQLQGNLAAEAAIEMNDRGSPPALPATTQERSGQDISTAVVNWDASQHFAASPASTAEATTPKLKRQGSSFAEISNPLQALVVDDDPLTRKLMSRMLQRLGHKVSTAENGEVALRMMARRHRPDAWGEQFHIVFLDNQMPVMTGIECARALRQMGSKIFIVGATGNALKEDQEEYNEAGADSLLTKPLREASMRQMIEEARKRVAGETQPRPSAKLAV